MSAKPPTIYLVAGERSGDAHGAALLRELRDLEPTIEFSGLGGPLMRAESGGESIRDWVEDAGVLGLWEVLKKYGWFRKRMEETVAEITALRPALVVLIDYPGFNLRLASRLQHLRPQTRVVQYISPQVWAWNRARIPRMATLLDLILCIFPFEAELYSASGLAAEFVGHPLGDSLETALAAPPDREPDLVGLFPGSRMREIEKHLPAMLECVPLVAKDEPETRWIVSAASEKLATEITVQIAARGLQNGVQVVTGGSRAWMQRCGRGIVASGTATLEAAMLGLPHCLIYRVARPTYWIGRLLVRVPHLGIVNILAKRGIVREFVQNQLTPENLAAWLRDTAPEPARKRLQQEMAAVTATLRQPGAHARTAQAVHTLIARA